jgi:tripartite-type tricarboxylate transporter receptor subunit TctC
MVLLINKAEANTRAGKNCAFRQCRTVKGTAAVAGFALREPADNGAYSRRITLRKLSHRGAVALAALAAGVSGTATTSAQAADFYKGKTLTILIGHNPGGSYDGYAQLAALHYGKHIPGNPKVIVQHRPGGGGGKAGLYFFSKAPNDGTMISLLPETMAHTQLMDPKRGRWDMSKVKYIGRFAPSNSAFGVRKEKGIKDIKEFLTKGIKVGCTGRTSQSSQIPLLIKNLEGANFTMVCGYRGSGPYMLAMERGEVDAISLNWATWNAKLLDKYKSGDYQVFMQVGLKRNRGIPDVPLIQEVVGTAKTKPLYEWAGAGADIGRALFGTPNMPADKVAILRTAFDKLVQDKAFEKDVLKRGFLFDPATGAEMDKISQLILSAPKDLVELAAKGMTVGFTEGCVNCAKPKKK